MYATINNSLEIQELINIYRTILSYIENFYKVTQIIELMVTFRNIGPTSNSPVQLKTDIKFFNNLKLTDYQEYLVKFNNKWSLKDVTLEYLQADCISLHQVLISFGNLIFDNYKIDINSTLIIAIPVLKGSR